MVSFSWNEDEVDTSKYVNEAKPQPTFGPKDKSPKQKLKEQRKSLSEFNGPCVLCLEPDNDSKIHIQAFREILRKKLFRKFDPFSPSSTVTTTNTRRGGGRQSFENNGGLPKSILKQHGLKRRSGGYGSYYHSSDSTLSNAKLKTKRMGGATFRPLISLGSFSTVTKAVEVARKLQQVWEPLTFRVNDVQLVSKLEPSSSAEKIENGSSATSNSEIEHSHGIQKEGYGEKHESAVQDFHISKGRGRSDSPSVLSSSAKGEYGCDAMIMLMGQEEQLVQKQDGAEEEHESNEEEILKLLLSEADIRGGSEESSSSEGDKSSSEEDTDDDDEGDDGFLDYWLEDDEDFEDGATIIIGRTQYFMGEIHYLPVI